MKRDGILAIDREPMTVKDYICENTVDGALYSANSLTVSGIFKPMSDRHWGCTLASGATLDLTDWEGPWNTASASGRTVIFPTPPVATVNVNAAGRTDLSTLQKDANGKRVLVSWATEPENTTFILDNDTKGKGWKLCKESDGLKLKVWSTIIILR